MQWCLIVELLDKLESLIHIDHRLLLNVVIPSEVWSRLVVWDLREGRDSGLMIVERTKISITSIGQRMKELVQVRILLDESLPC